MALHSVEVDAIFDGECQFHDQTDHDGLEPYESEEVARD